MRTSIIKLTLVAALTAAGAASALADRGYSGSDAHLPGGEGYEGGGTSAAHAPAPYGYATTAAPAREIRLADASRYLNVTRMETVRIVAGGKTVTWNFDTLSTNAFPLSKIIPGADGITVFVSESPLYRGA